MSSIIDSFVHHINEQHLNVHSVRVLQKGIAIGAWDRTRDMRRLQHSVSKSFTCMAIGLALAEGTLTLESRLGEYFTSPTPASHLTAFPLRISPCTICCGCPRGMMFPCCGRKSEPPFLRKIGRNITCPFL
ncbi:hypothetical protein [Paenibacillus sp. 1A_MP2]|uniref:hypothetical protein n=1 Tax=Paenibacillus sp. 1A_MP2 TaxID=3457495 RepID=UPI003FCD81DD